ncbi:hypothetical protein VBM87_02245 [Mycoplasma sp. 744]|uniref:hypothetical protein n=1 Tax=Mycoplasma sp. 744 TaxID=3108531 RepID=UPI002B1D8570|nr:hypothetical protein [Mycoplasma sp. 744]MEA4115592.1 hypothetical protein [Mycoplasma sp. 744]
MKIKYFNNFKKIENNTNKIYKKNINFAVESLLFILFLFFSVLAILIHYNNDFLNQNNTLFLLKKIYVFSFGLLFGDTLIPFIVFILGLFLIRWITFFYRKKYIPWFQNHLRVNYLILRNQIIFIWISLILLSLVFYHLYLVLQRVENFWYYNVNNVKLIYTNGWYKNFIGSIDDLPNVKNNIGFLLDSIFNLPYVISFSPFLTILITLFFSIYIILKFLYVKPFYYYKKLSLAKHSLNEIKKELENNLLFEFTDDCYNYFLKINKACEEYDLNKKKSLKIIIKNIKKNDNYYFLTPIKINDFDYFATTKYEKIDKNNLEISNSNNTLINNENEKIIDDYYPLNEIDQFLDTEYIDIKNNFKIKENEENSIDISNNIIEKTTLEHENYIDDDEFNENLNILF